MNGKEGESTNGKDALHINMKSRSKSQSSEGPTCKICLESGELIGRNVCDCRGTVANICFECLRNSIISISERKGFTATPICPDCNAPYRHLNYKMRRNDISFMQFLNSEGLTTSEIWQTMSIPPICWTIFSVVLYFIKLLIGFLRRESREFTFNPFEYVSTTVIWSIGSVLILIGGYLFLGACYGAYYVQYLRRPLIVAIDVIGVTQELSSDEESSTDQEQTPDQDVVLQID